MPDGSRNDPYGQFNFQVDIQNVGQAAFSEVSGLSTDTNIIEYRTGSDKHYTPTKLPGLMKYANLVFKRGFTKDQALWKWRKQVIDGQTTRAAVTITLLDEAGNPALKFKAREAWPSKWEGPAMNAKTSEVAIETLELAHEGLEQLG